MYADEDDDDDEVDVSDGSGPSVHLQSLLRLRRPATGVSGQESLSDSEESRLSPARGPLGRGEVCNEANEEVDEDEGMDSEGDAVETDFVLIDKVVVVSDASAGVVPSEETVETEDSISEWASVNFTVLISSSSGVRKDTRFSAGNNGLAAAILRGFGPLESMERTLCGCLYGMMLVAESVEADVRADDSVDAELGVDALFGALQLLSMDRRSLDGRPVAGAAEAGC
ncbi:hypothetical protein SLS60_004173 [Paraconiothyrium brasiliense]|uniref:Uncharacterized protein n=1 Tax=Paraconiothyrium brasiliense TaxID=300254 RepID=A0ABR3RQS8_9PLEO